jgi:hypothetical protein
MRVVSERGCDRGVEMDEQQVVYGAAVCLCLHNGSVSRCIVAIGLILIAGRDSVDHSSKLILRVLLDSYSRGCRISFHLHLHRMRFPGPFPGLPERKLTRFFHSFPTKSGSLIGFARSHGLELS